MRSAVFCHAASELPLAREIGAFLELNLPFECFYDEGVIRLGHDLIETVSGALSADLAILLLSPDSIPKRWIREKWEPVLLEQPRQIASQLLIVLARPCKFPELLRRQFFCDVSQNQRDGLRSLKQQILSFRPPVHNMVDLPPHPDPVAEATQVDSLRESLADHPGVATQLDRDTALAFAHACKSDFEGVFWIDCTRRTRAGVLGDVARVLHLRLSGSVHQNERALHEFCQNHRCLFVFEHLENEAWITFHGRSSVIITTPAPPRPAQPLHQIVSLFSSWIAREPECLRALGDAHHHLQQLDDWATLTRLGPAVIAVLKHNDRLAETHEILDLLLAGASLHHDQDTADHYRWEQTWILGHWGEPYSQESLPPQQTRTTTQLGFDFV